MKLENLNIRSEKTRDSGRVILVLAICFFCVCLIQAANTMMSEDRLGQLLDEAHQQASATTP